MRPLLFVLLMGCGPESSQPSKPDVSAQIAPRSLAEELRAQRDVIAKELETIASTLTAASAQLETASTDDERAAIRTILDKAHGDLAKFPDRIEALKAKTRDDPDRDVRVVWEYLYKDTYDHADLEKKLRELGDALLDKQTAADRASAMERLEKLRRDKAEMDRRIREAKKK